MHALLDKILQDGDKYYSLKKNDDYPNADDIMGLTDIFNPLQIEINVDVSEIFQSQGYLKCVPGADTGR